MKYITEQEFLDYFNNTSSTLTKDDAIVLKTPTCVKCESLFDDVKSNYYTEQDEDLVISGKKVFGFNYTGPKEQPDATKLIAELCLVNVPTFIKYVDDKPFCLEYNGQPLEMILGDN